MQRVYEENEWGKVSKRIITDGDKDEDEDEDEENKDGDEDKPPFYDSEIHIDLQSPFCMNTPWHLTTIWPRFCISWLLDIDSDSLIIEFASSIGFFGTTTTLSIGMHYLHVSIPPALTYSPASVSSSKAQYFYNCSHPFSCLIHQCSSSSLPSTMLTPNTFQHPGTLT